jgi:hypothetical protein
MPCAASPVAINNIKISVRDLNKLRTMIIPRFTGTVECEGWVSWILPLATSSGTFSPGICDQNFYSMMDAL